MNTPLLLMSFGVGLLIGLTGIGGAALMAPFLLFVVGVRPVTAVGTDLVFGAITKLVGAWAHLRQATVDLVAVRRLSIGSVPGGIAGAAVVVLLPRDVHATERYVRTALGIVLILVALVLCARIVFASQNVSGSSRVFGDRALPFWGAAVGLCVGFTSVGSGSLLAPVLLTLYPKRTATVVGTDIVHGAILVAATGSIYAGSRAVEWSLLPTLLTGSIPGVLIGSRLAARLPSRPLRVALAAVLLVSGYRLL